MRAFIADMTASIIFFTVAAMTTELFIAKLSFEQSLQARLIAIPFMLVTARPYGIYRDWVFGHLRIPPARRYAVAVLDTATFISFQLPVYAGILLYAGATPAQIAVACASATGGMLICARPFGLFLDLVRRLFRVPQPA